MNTVGAVELRGIARAVADARERVWRAAGRAARFVIDLDATLVTCRTAKQDAAATWKRSFGYHPLLALDAARGEVLALLMRPGKRPSTCTPAGSSKRWYAGSNTASDHVIAGGTPASSPTRPTGTSPASNSATAKEAALKPSSVTSSRSSAADLMV
ncbi:MAG: transposase [Acidimicrobiia bacterium]|nr:transposase [Acidimicrobiia bacterium]